MIPYERLSQPAVNQLLGYLVEELRRTRGERRELETKWIRWHELYRAQPPVKEKTFPFRGASNIVVPVAATDIDTVAARILGILFAPGNLWSVQPLMPEMVEYAPKLQEFLEWAQKNEVDAYNVLNDFVLELCKLGTAVVKTRYKREYKKVYEFRELPQGVHEAHQNIMIANHPSIHRVALPDFYIPPGFPDIQQAPWVCERLSLTWSELVRRQQAGIYQGVERIATWQRAVIPEVERRLQELDRYRASYGMLYDIHEFWLDYDIDGDGQMEAVVCTIHEPSMSYLRIDFNPFFNQEKPYDSARYMRVEGRFYGIGLCEMTEQPQDEVSAMHNQRIDNATIANTTMFKALRTSGVKKDEPIYTGKIWLLDNLDDVDTMKMGEKYDTTIQNEVHTLGLKNQRTGVNDYIQGNNQPEIGYGTATTTMAMLREGAKRFDQTMREIRDCWSRVGTKVIEGYQQFNQYGKEFYALGQEDGNLVRQMLMFPLDIIRRSMKIDVTATSAALNKEMEIRTNTILMQLLDGYHMQLIQFMQIAINPMAPPPLRMVAMEAAMGKSVLLRRIFDSYGVQDADALIPDMEEALGVGIRQLATGTGPFGGGAGLAPGLGLSPGMGGVPEGAGGFPGLQMAGAPNGNGGGLPAPTR